MPQVLSKDRNDTGIAPSQAGLDKLGEAIMVLWEERVRSEVKSAGELLRPALRNALPRFLELLGQALGEDKSRGLEEEGSRLVRQHAGERATMTHLSPAEIVKELQVLRETVTTQLEEELSLSKRDYETIQKTFDQTIQEALMEFFLVHARLREQFMMTLSHDLRTPLSVAKMSAQMLDKEAAHLDDPKVREKLKRLSNRITDSMKRADRMIQDLLDASFLRIGEKIPLHISECDLFEIAHEVVLEIDPQERSRIRISGNSIRGHWDCEGLRRSLENLVKNAVKYGSADTPIDIELEKLNERVRLSVHNWGNPIPESEKGMIFRAFNRAQSAQVGRQQGWGIGLALVKAVAESLGGKVNVESSKESGTKFTIDVLRDARNLPRE